MSSALGLGRDRCSLMFASEGVDKGHCEGVKMESSEKGAGRDRA